MTRFLLSVLLLASSFSTQPPAAGQGNMSVVLYFVQTDGVQIDGAYQACGDGAVAGPFMSGDSAIDWTKSFLPTGKVISRLSTDDGVCQGPALMYDQDRGWYRYTG